MAKNLLTDSKIQSLIVPAGKSEVQISDVENLYLRLKEGKSGNFGKIWDHLLSLSSPKLG